MIHCRINNKIYIGKSKDIGLRWKGERRSGINEHFDNAVKKYGIENFEFKILIECALEDLDKWEILLISRFRSFIPERGYNVTMGGTGGNTWMRKETMPVICLETKEIFRNANQCACHFGFSRSHLSDVLHLRSTRLRVNKLHFMYYVEGKDYDKELSNLLALEAERKRAMYKKVGDAQRGKSKPRR
jgi:group I intron endonuclease